MNTRENVKAPESSQELCRVIDSYDYLIDRYNIGLQLKMIVGGSGQDNPLLALVNGGYSGDKVKDVLFSLGLFGMPKLFQYDNEPTPLYLADVPACNLGLSPGGGTALLYPKERLMLRLFGAYPHSGMVASLIASDYYKNCLQKTINLEVGHDHQGLRPR